MPVPIVLAIEPDRRQAAHVSAVVKHRVGAELILAETTERALDAIGTRVPDLVLVPALLSPQDDAALAAALRVIAAAAHVRTLTIPVFASNGAGADGGGGLLARFRRGRTEPSSSVGCDPAVFAEQITEYLREAAAERAEREVDFHAYETAPRPVADEAPIIESRIIESPAIEPPAVDATVDVPIEPVRFIAPAVVNRRVPTIEPQAPALEFVPEATAKFGDHASFERRLAEEIAPRSGRGEDSGEAPIAAKDPAHHEIVVEASRDAAATVRQEFHAEETLKGEGFGAFTLSPDQPLEPAKAVAVVSGTNALDPEADILREFVEEPPASRPIDTSAWSELGLRHMRQWPAIEGASAENGSRLADLAAAVAPRPRTSTKSESVKQATAKQAPVPQAAVEQAPEKHAPAPQAAAEQAAKQAPALQAPVEQAAPAQPQQVAVKQAPGTGGNSTRPAAHRPDPLDWAELVASLRQDMDRRRKQPTAPAPAAAVPPPAPSPAQTPAPAPAPAPAPIAPVKPVASVTPIAQAAPRPVEAPPRAQLHAIEGAGRRDRKPSAVQDEWGFFDPQQCGFAALLAKLDEYSNADEPEVRKTS